MTYPRKILKTPATNPLIMTIMAGSFPEITRVKLLSIPQQMQASMIRSEPGETPNDTRGSYVRMSPPMITAVIATIARLPTCSLNTTPAIRAVHASSAFNRSDAFEAGTEVRPVMKRIGAMMLPVAIIPTSQGISPFLTGASL
jgi:hypothetical protein